MQTIPFGHWPSPLTPESMTSGQVTLDEVRLDGPDTYWLEGRPLEGGRMVLVRHDGSTGRASDVVGPGWNVRSRVHEYGGGSYAVGAGTVVLVDFATGRLLRLDPGSVEPQPISPDEPAVRFGGLVLHGDTVWAVREDHRGGSEPTNHLVALDLRPGPGSVNEDFGRVLWSGSDFVSRPAVSPDGRSVAFVTWDHPDMPWDTTVLRRIPLTADGVPGEPEVVAGGDSVSIVQPTFAPDGTLWFVSDESGWWNLHRDEGSGPRPAHPMPADVAEPQWVLGMHDLAVLDDGRVLFRHWVDGFPRLGLLDPATDAVDELLPHGVLFDQLVATGADIAVRVGLPDRLPAVLRGRAGGPLERLRESSDAPLDPAYVSVAEARTWTSSEGLEVHGFLRRPRHRDVTGPADELPPLIVMAHGGPTGQTEPSFSMAEHFWTTRGFAVLQVNYSGSTGWGRAYRERLRGQWGVRDIDDCVTGALALAASGDVDRRSLLIRGGSAGGYVVLRAMTTSDAFAAGTSYFGVADLAALAAETHKLESRYLDGLVAPWPEGRDVYRDRSPVHHVADLHGEVLLLQGADDLVVPLGQAEEMAAAMRAAGKRVELVVYPGEGHGFRGRDAIVDSLTRELAFYQRVLAGP